jgi:hypothetical protein
MKVGGPQFGMPHAIAQDVQASETAGAVHEERKHDNRN